MAENSKIPVFPFDKIVKVEINGGFYVRVSQLLLSYAQQHNVNDMVQFLEELKTREPKTEYEYHLLTLLTLISSIEAAAATQGVIEVREIAPQNTGEKPPGN